MNILIVENHSDTLDCLKTFCEGRGHVVECASTLAEALAKLAEGQPDLLLCDIGLPDGTGWELPHKAGLHPTVFAVAMSGFGMIADNRRSLEAGFRSHLLKPFRVAELEAILREAAPAARPEAPKP